MEKFLISLFSFIVAGYLFWVLFVAVFVISILFMMLKGLDFEELTKRQRYTMVIVSGPVGWIVYAIVYLIFLRK